MDEVLSSGQVARRLGVPRWQVMDLFDRGVLPEVPMVAGRRIVPLAMLPAIRRALEARGCQTSRRACPAPSRYLGEGLND